MLVSVEFADAGTKSGTRAYAGLRGDQTIMTMHINLSPEMEDYIKGKASSGFYGNATEVIRDAIRRMQATERQIAAFHTAVAKGNGQLRPR